MAVSYPALARTVRMRGSCFLPVAFRIGDTKRRSRSSVVFESNDKNHIFHVKGSKEIKIRDIRFRRIGGTSATEEAVKLICSKASACEGLEMTDIDLKYVGNKRLTTTSTCSNVKPKCSSKQQPAICTVPRFLRF